MSAPKRKRKAPGSEPLRELDMRDACPLYLWLWENKAFPQLQSEDGVTIDRSNPTHLLMDGKYNGVIKLADNLNRDFLALYAEDINNGVKLYISEQRTPVFKYYFDLDIKRKEYFQPPLVESIGEESKSEVPLFAQSLDEKSLNIMILQYCKDMLETIRLFYPPATPGEKFKMIICQRDHIIESHEPKVCNIGVHVIMPNLHVDATMARVMREAAVGRFLKLYGPMEHVQNPWSTMLDDQVYLGNGLRMLGSRKTLKCRACKGNPEQKRNCIKCRGWGKEDIGRVYAPWRVLKVTNIGEVAEDVEELTRLTRDMTHQVVTTSVRLFNVATTLGWKPYSGCPSIPHIGNGSEVVLVHGKKQLRFKENLAVLNRIRNKINIPYDHEKYEMVEEYIRNMINPKYRNISITNIFTNSTGKWYIIEPVGDGSNYCMNVGRDHHSNGIYFLMTQKGIFQKCYCRCNTTQGRRFGLCKEYTSQLFPMTKQIKSLFFQNDLDKTPDDLRNSTLKRTTVHSHAKAVERAVNFLRAWLRETYEARTAPRQLPNRFSRGSSMSGARSTTVTKPRQQQQQQYFSKNGNAVDDSSARSQIKKKSRKPVIEEDDEDMNDVACP